LTQNIRYKLHQVYEGVIILSSVGVRSYQHYLLRNLDSLLMDFALRFRLLMLHRLFSWAFRI